MFVLSYFETGAEALHLAVSERGYHWDALNGGEALLWSDVGAESVRDPFLCRGPDGAFHLLGTDGWHSDRIVHATSPDLIEWSEPELVPVMGDVPGTRNAWAPECFRDREAGVYRLVWSSTVNPGGDPEERDHRIWTCSTPDFETYGPATCLFDPGHTVIDATVVRQNGEYVMVFKDERGENSLDTDHKDLHVCRAPSGGGPFGEVSAAISPRPVEGPTLFHNGEEWLLFYDHFLEDVYGASRSDDLREWDVTEDVSFPEGVRHASVLEVEESVGERLRSELG